MSTLNVTPEPATELTTHTLERIQLWRQVGWIGQTGRVYELHDQAGLKTEPASFRPLWILVDNERPVLDDESEAR